MKYDLTLDSVCLMALDLFARHFTVQQSPAFLATKPRAFARLDGIPFPHSGETLGDFTSRVLRSSVTVLAGLIPDTVRAFAVPSLPPMPNRAVLKRDDDHGLAIMAEHTCDKCFALTVGYVP